ncbi:Trihelix transcription factor GT-4 like [Heracleum sosnowskyi]|uniref:Trihelix transcription factor GT-4 like n=1 Tax=Heracleum sosnowskyi TaxID=360622 RepID=A0AAD8HRG6_9APIA|nr:Trihelix transcription factor GT-4 like [Heracleum sosnowskyi]
MEGNLQSGNLLSGMGSYGGGGDLQGSMLVHHQQQPSSLHQQQQQSDCRQGTIAHPSIHDNFPRATGGRQDYDPMISMAEYSRTDKGKHSMSDEEEPSFTDDAAEGHNYGSRGKNVPHWHRVKWTDTMVRLMITAVSYIGEDLAAEYGGGTRRKYANLQKKGKWKSVSKVMAERGHFVSPQQCEDKFNDLNKRYKRLNEILGRGTSCEVVENHSLLEVMDHIPEKLKEEVRKILSSKHLYYEEMCSYHNGNRLHLPPDPELQYSLRLALRSKDDHESTETRKHPHIDIDNDDQDIEMEDRGSFLENQASQGDCRGAYGIPGASMKRVKQCQGHESNAFEGVNANLSQTQWMERHTMQIERQKLQLQAEMLELEKERFKWQKLCRKQDRELEMMRMENERMKLKNEHMALELKSKEMGANN